MLSNLLLDDLDQELARRGHRFCRYADDCNIYVRSRRAGERVMASICRFLTTKLRLTVNLSKSAVARTGERQFLGFRIPADPEPQRHISPKSLLRFKRRVRELTRRTRGVSLPQLIPPLARYLIGWRAYYGLCQTPRQLENLDAWTRRRLRMYIWRQWTSGPDAIVVATSGRSPRRKAAITASRSRRYHSNPVCQPPRLAHYPGSPLFTICLFAARGACTDRTRAQPRR